jgi:dTMP kinase
MNNKLKLKPHQYEGKLIVFEGTDGAGKTTMISMTEQYLKERMGEGKVLCVKQPTDLSRKTKLFQKMMYCSNHDDIDYRAVQLLTMSDRLQHAFEVIGPALKEGKTVVCDRYIYTSLANMLARGYLKEKWFFSVATNILKPDIAFLAYVPADIAIQRIKSRPSECDRYLDEGLLYNVSREFIKMAKRENLIVLDTSQSPVNVFEVVKAYLGGIINE